MNIMNENNMAKIRIAILVENMYEDVEFWYPYYRMKEEGAEVTVVGSGSSEYTEESMEQR